MSLVVKKKPRSKRLMPRAGAQETTAVTKTMPSPAKKVKPKPRRATKPQTEEKDAVSPTPRDKYGFRSGSDVSVVLEQLLIGGRDKHDVATRIGEIFNGQMTRGGRPKPVSTVMNQVENQMRARGFKIESTWRLVPPTEKLSETLKDSMAKVTKDNHEKSAQKTSQRRPKPKPRARRH